MMRTNKAMRDLLLHHAPAPELHLNLAQILNNGFRIVGDLVYFERLFLERGLPSEFFELDSTGLEVFVNSFHTDDYVDDGHLEQALRFIFVAGSVWNSKYQKKVNGKMLMAAAVTELGVNLKFFKKRTNEPYFSDDLEDYLQPILVMKFSGE